MFVWLHRTVSDTSELFIYAFKGGWRLISDDTNLDKKTQHKGHKGKGAF